MSTSVKKWFPIVFLTIVLFGGFAYAGPPAPFMSVSGTVVLGEDDCKNCDCPDGCLLPDGGRISNSGSDDEITLRVEDEVSILPIEDDITLPVEDEITLPVEDEITLPVEDEISILPIEEEVSIYDSTDCLDGCVLPDE